MAVASPQRLILIGLGNPGTKYAHTRHNVGFMVVEELARLMGWNWQLEKRFNAKVAKGVYENKMIDLVQPLTFMNISGWTVKQYLDFFKLSAQQIVIVYDDTALPFGQCRVRCQGSAGGHNGIKSVIAYLGSDQFIRLRMGIGSNAAEIPLADYVLSEFTLEETVALDAFIKRGAAILKSLIIETVTQVMNQVNTKLTL